MIAAEDAEIIRQAIANLGGREAEVIQLMLAGMTTGEIAERFGCNPAAVSCYKGRAISKIRAALVM